MQEAVADVAAAVTIDGSAVARGSTVAYLTILHACAVHGIHSTSVGGVVAVYGIVVVGIAVLYTESVQHGALLQGLGTPTLVKAVGGKEDYVVGVAGVCQGIVLARVVPFEVADTVAVEVARQGGDVLQPDRLAACRGREVGTCIRAFVVDELTLLVGIETTCRTVCVGIVGLCIVGIESAVYADAGEHLKGKVERGTSALLRTFGRRVGTGCHVYLASRGDAVGDHVAAKVVDGILYVRLGGCPTESRVGIAARIVGAAILDGGSHVSRQVVGLGVQGNGDAEHQPCRKAEAVQAGHVPYVISCLHLSVHCQFPVIHPILRRKPSVLFLFCVWSFLYPGIHPVPCGVVGVGG